MVYTNRWVMNLHVFPNEVVAFVFNNAARTSCGKLHRFTFDGKPFESPFGVTDQYVSRLIAQIKNSRQKSLGCLVSTLVLTLTTGVFDD